MAGPCDDIRIIDLSSGPAGGLATMVLADFGADVLKVEPPGGDPARAQAAAPMWLRGKRSIVLDLAQPADQERLHALVRGADVVVASYAPDEATVHGADYATLSALNPGLVYCSITGWGPRGPYAHYPADAALVAAKSGRMQVMSGIVNREGPAFPGLRSETHVATQSALAGILAALIVRDRTGAGQLVETSLLQGMFPFDMNSLLHEQLSQRFPLHFPGGPADGLTLGAQPILGYQPVQAADGQWIQFANLLEHLFQASIVALGLTDEVIANPRYAGAPRSLTPETADEVRHMMLERARERPAAEWMQIFREHGNVAADLVRSSQEALSHPDLLANGEVVDVVDPRLGSMRQLGPLARLTATPGHVGGPAPLVGEHTAAVLAEPPRSPWHAPTPSTNRRPAHPLDGVTILEFATIIAAPLGAALLADLGARVIKVEPTGGGDPWRAMGTGVGGYILAAKTTAGKESICVDLKSEHGQAIVARLIERADVLIHNYRPGVPERLGIGFERARALRPGIVHVSVNGYGPLGPAARQAAAHPIAGAVCGGALLQAGAAWPPDTSTIEGVREAARWFYKANEANPDPNTSVTVASATLLGLYAQRRTAEAQQVFLSMLGANGYANYEDFLSYAGKPPRTALDAELYGTSALYRLYPAADGWVFLALPQARTDDEPWAAFCAAAGHAALAADPRFAVAEARRAHDAELAEALGALFRERPAAAWEQTLIAAGIGCVEVLTALPGSFFAGSEQMRANGFDVQADHAMWGRHQRWGPTVVFADTPGRYRGGALAGDHTDAILAEIGYDASAIADLRARGVVDSTPPIDLSAPPATVEGEA